MIQVTGTISSILYRNDDFLIGVMQTDGDGIKIKGNIYGVEKSERIEVTGEWETHPTYGDQFFVESWQRPIPQTEGQILAFLSSPMVKGCGKKQARQIIKRFGIEALETISEEREGCLIPMKGIGKKRATSIVQSIQSTFEVLQTVSQLLIYGITTKMAIRAYKEFGSNTVKILMKNPYKLTDMDVIGFLMADEIAKRIGIMPTSGYRIGPCLRYMLKKLCFESGHTFIPEKELFDETEKALNHNSNQVDVVTRQEVKNGIYRLEEQSIIIEDGCIYPKFLYQHEVNLARKLSRMRGSRDGGAMSFLDKHIENYQKEQSIILAEKQHEAIYKLFKEQVFVLTGGPGTGKTTVIRAMLDIYKDIYPDDTIRLAAPTGRASQKLSEVAQREASTIHRLIGYRQGKPPEFNGDNTLPCNLLIVDEMSMVDVSLASILLQALDKDTKVVFVGDTDQLPSVSPGNVLRDMIHARLPTIQLTEVFRQALESQIINNAHRINKGKSILFTKQKDDFYFLSQENPDKIAALMVRSVKRFMEIGYSLSDILLLSPMRKGMVGTIALNEQLREALNPARQQKPEWQIGKGFFREGDKVIQTKNNYEKHVFNGDIGIIQSFEKEYNEDGETIDVMNVNYVGKIISYTKTDTKELELGYAITIHKAQGGEAPVVIMPATTSHYVMLARNLLYTGMTRAQEKLVFIGTKQAMNIAIQNHKTLNRNSNLKNRIITYKDHHQRLLQVGGDGT